MSDPTPVNVYSVMLMVSTTTGNQTQQIQKQINVLAGTMQDAIGKAIAATPNSEARQCNLVCVVNVP